ncbi:uncharacterized protein BDR25DRAFT_360897 [Lindgomyces ingoldianus]|uniref:Uncharacterized protein n=1 Tax=Lindgomyces ingoldianus TaxID=673940 RepID=A0ACB6QEF1_9PLEO|nr:uncharacterized protein BDR25DRAFT_360897 [Lindgomyces ingoldianus]KAF2464993.1 hypothetical protein BDR25DRAFT_360897 [Lindgomyces ingoldianus]
MATETKPSESVRMLYVERLINTACTTYTVSLCGFAFEYITAGRGKSETGLHADWCLTWDVNTILQTAFRIFATVLTYQNILVKLRFNNPFRGPLITTQGPLNYIGAGFVGSHVFRKPIMPSLRFINLRNRTGEELRRLWLRLRHFRLLAGKPTDIVMRLVIQREGVYGEKEILRGQQGTYLSTRTGYLSIISLFVFYEHSLLGSAVRVRLVIYLLLYLGLVHDTLREGKVHPPPTSPPKMRLLHLFSTAMLLAGVLGVALPDARLNSIQVHPKASHSLLKILVISQLTELSPAALSPPSPDKPCKPNCECVEGSQPPQGRLYCGYCDGIWPGPGETLPGSDMFLCKNDSCCDYGHDARCEGPINPDKYCPGGLANKTPLLLPVTPSITDNPKPSPTKLTTRRPTSNSKMSTVPTAAKRTLREENVSTVATVKRFCQILIIRVGPSRSREKTCFCTVITEHAAVMDATIHATKGGPTWNGVGDIRLHEYRQNEIEDGWQSIEEGRYMAWINGMIRPSCPAREGNCKANRGSSRTLGIYWYPTTHSP